MKKIVISGISGSGKTFLASKLKESLKNILIIQTDSYYSDNLLIKFLSLFFYDIYDRLISINKKELINTINSIDNEEKQVKFYNYDFKNKKSSYKTKIVDYKEIDYLLIEGIFSHRLDLNYSNTINILCVGNEHICLERRLKRDKTIRGRDTSEVLKRFRSSCTLYFKNSHEYRNSRIHKINSIDNEEYSNLILKLKK